MWSLVWQSEAPLIWSPSSQSAHAQEALSCVLRSPGSPTIDIAAPSVPSPIINACLKPPSKLERNLNYHLSKSGIKPMWEDDANANGCKWVLTMKSNPQMLNHCWSWLAIALVGEDLDKGDEICGAVASLRSKVDWMELGTRSKEDV